MTEEIAKNAFNDKLKGSVSYGRTVNLGQFQSLRIDWTEEFYLDEKTPEQVWNALRVRAETELQKSGLTK